jgi:hypothetical protein
MLLAYAAAAVVGGLVGSFVLGVGFLGVIGGAFAGASIFVALLMAFVLTADRNDNP